MTQNRNNGFTPVAHPLFSANPAADDFMREPPFTFKVAPAFVYEYTGLQSGGFVSSASVGSTFRPGENGTLMTIYGRTDVFDSTTRQGIDFGLNSDNFTLRYSRHVRHNLTLGGSVKLSRGWSQLRDATTKVESNAFIADFVVGALAGLGDRWTVGAMVSQQPAWSKAEIWDNGTKSKESSRALLSRYRAGTGYRPAANIGLYLDGEYLRVGSEDARMNFARGNFLAEYLATPVLALRAGAVIDSTARVTYNAGVGYYGFSAVKIDVAYSRNAFMEVRHEFGTMNYMYLILSTSF